LDTIAPSAHGPPYVFSDVSTGGMGVDVVPVQLIVADDGDVPAGRWLR
jgi:hypothetical protein